MESVAEEIYAQLNSNHYKSSIDRLDAVHLLQASQCECNQEMLGAKKILMETN